MDLTKSTSSKAGEILQSGQDVHWSHNAAAATMVAAAVLLVLGRPRRALAVAAAGATMTLFERPQAAQELWSRLPEHIRTGQDFLVRAEAFIEKVAEQAIRVRETISRQA